MDAAIAAATWHSISQIVAEKDNIFRFAQIQYIEQQQQQTTKEEV